MKKQTKIIVFVKQSPRWALFSFSLNIILFGTLAYLWQNQQTPPTPLSDSSFLKSSVSSPQVLAVESVPTPPDLGERHYLDYEQWLNLLRQEADAIAQQKPERLNLLLGDSISLWFPSEQLPPQQVWLNQGISGETSRGLLKRLNLVNQTEPERIFIMIGINDLLRGIKDDSIIANHLLIIRYLRKAHPQSQIVIQSILPHSGEKATWEGKEKLLALPNTRIQNLNQRLEEIATAEGVIFLDLYPLFSDEEGNLRLDFSTDGLHLSNEGYEVWRSALQVFNLIYW